MSNNYDVKLVNVSKNYEGQKVLNNLNISFSKNEISVILGPSGCGKTTLLNIIAGIEKIDNGKILRKYNNISYIFQEDRLIPWLTVYENIEFVLKSYMDKKEAHNTINKVLKIVKLEEDKDKLPDKLSGGMKRRVSIARAFAHKSRVLIMDEPFKGLDLQLKEHIMREFLNIWQEDKKTVIIVTHNIEEAKFLGNKIYYFSELNSKG